MIYFLRNSIYLALFLLISCESLDKSQDDGGVSSSKLTDLPRANDVSENPQDLVGVRAFAVDYWAEDEDITAQECPQSAGKQHVAYYRHRNNEFGDGDNPFDIGWVEANESKTVLLRWASYAELDAAGFKNLQPQHNNDRGFCTGTILPNRFVLTAGHCLDSETFPYKRYSDGELRVAERKDVAPFIEVVTDYKQLNGKIVENLSYRLESIILVHNVWVQKRPKLDFAVVKVNSQPRANPWINEAGAQNSQPLDIVLFENQPSASFSKSDGGVGDKIAIVQHPQGGAKKIAIGKVTSTTNDEIKYNKLDTLKGSSGAGVLNAQGELIGVHVAGLCRRDANGAIPIQNILKASDLLKMGVN